MTDVSTYITLQWVTNMVLFAGSCHPLALNEPRPEPYRKCVVSNGSWAGGGAAPAGPAAQPGRALGRRLGEMGGAPPPPRLLPEPGGLDEAAAGAVLRGSGRSHLLLTVLFVCHLMLKNSVLFINFTYVTYMWLVCKMYISTNVTQWQEADAWFFFVMWYSGGLNRLNY